MYYYYLIDNGYWYSCNEMYFIKTERDDVDKFLVELNALEYVTPNQPIKIVGRWDTPPDFWDGEWVGMDFLLERYGWDLTSGFELDLLPQFKPWEAELKGDKV